MKTRTVYVLLEVTSNFATKEIVADMRKRAAGHSIQKVHRIVVDVADATKKRAKPRKEKR